MKNRERGEYVGDVEAREYLQTIKEILLTLLERSKNGNANDEWNDLMKELQAMTLLASELPLTVFPMAQLILLSISSIVAGPKGMGEGCKKACLSLGEHLDSLPLKDVEYFD